MILVLNCGSSSIKYAVFTTQLKQLTEGNIENVKDHESALKSLFSSLAKSKTDKISYIWHRIVHGGELFRKSTNITAKNMKQLESLNELAPLHNPIQVKCIKLCQKLFPKTPNIAVFDTAFHQSMTPEHYLYALPQKYYQKYSIRKYGFHGTSHHYLREEYAKKQSKNQTIITCHLGNGASLALIKNGKVIETSMGFTPLEGVIMGTRCGSIDPAIIPFLAEQENLSPTQILDIMNKKSWLLAVSERTSDMKELIERYKSDPKSKLAINMFVNAIVKYIGAYTALANGIDAVVFSGGIGERSAFIRNQIKKHLTFLWPIKFLTIPTNEELMIAKECLKVK